MQWRREKKSELKSNDNRTNSESNFDEARKKKFIEIEFVDETSSFASSRKSLRGPRTIRYLSSLLLSTDGSFVFDVREAGSVVLPREDRRKCVTVQEEHDDVRR